MVGFEYVIGMCKPSMECFKNTLHVIEQCMYMYAYNQHRLTCVHLTPGVVVDNTYRSDDKRVSTRHTTQRKMYRYTPFRPVHVGIQWNLSVTTTSILKFITCDLFSNVF